MQVTETTKLLVAELEMQQKVVNRATENADNARAKLNDIHRDQRHVADELQQLEDLLDKAAIERHKSNVAALKASERDLSTTLQDMEQRLKTALEKLADIEAELNAAISRLEPIRKGGGQN